MFGGRSVSVVLPAFDEEASVGDAVRAFRARPEVDEVVVVDNNSRDRTAALAAAAGARVVPEARQGFGFACRGGLAAARGELLVLAEPDGTFRAEDLPRLLAGLDGHDAVLGSRTDRALHEPGARMTGVHRLGNVAVARLLRALHGGPRLSDVGCTYRALRRAAWERIAPALSVGGVAFIPEMTIALVRAGLRCTEVGVRYGARRGESKFTGNLRGSVRVGWRMTRVIVSRWRRR
jgi:glycosyltransferase involved in cell wall biosynthesis